MTCSIILISTSIKDYSNWRAFGDIWFIVTSKFIWDQNIFYAVFLFQALIHSRVNRCICKNVAKTFVHNQYNIFPAHHDKIFKSPLSYMNFPIKLSALLQRKTKMQIYHFYLTSKLLQTSPIMWLFVRIDWNNVWQELGCVLQYCNS